MGQHFAKYSTRWVLISAYKKRVVSSDPIQGRSKWPQSFVKKNAQIFFKDNSNLWSHKTWVGIWNRIQLRISDPEVVGPPGSESRSFRQLKKQKIKKTLISTVLWLHNDLLSVKTDVNVPTGSNKQKKF
jgi:hypothetical protein